MYRNKKLGVILCVVVVSIVIIVACTWHYTFKVSGNIIFATDGHDSYQAGVYLYSFDTDSVKKLHVDGYNELKYVTKGPENSFYCVGSNEKGDTCIINANVDGTTKKSIKIQSVPEKIESFSDGVLLVYSDETKYLNFDNGEYMPLTGAVTMTDSSYQLISNSKVALYNSGEAYCLFSKGVSGSYETKELEGCIPDNSVLKGFLSEDVIVYETSDYEIIESNSDTTTAKYTISKNTVTYNLTTGETEILKSRIYIRNSDCIIGDGKFVLQSSVDSVFGSWTDIVHIKTGLRRRASKKVWNLYDSAYDMVWIDNTPGTILS